MGKILSLNGIMDLLMFLPYKVMLNFSTQNMTIGKSFAEAIKVINMGCLNTTVTLSKRDNLDKQDTQKEDDAKAHIVALGTGVQSLSYTTANQVKPHMARNAEQNQ